MSTTSDGKSTSQAYNGPTTECLRGVATYPQGDMKQARYGITLTDLVNTHKTRAVKEAMDSLILGRAASEVAVGDLVEML